MAKHDFHLDEDGNPDEWFWEISDWEYGDHAGPACKRCGDSWCQFCEPERWEEECPASAQ